MFLNETVIKVTQDGQGTRAHDLQKKLQGTGPAQPEEEMAWGDLIT